jgi:hypothetical protein
MYHTEDRKTYTPWQLTSPHDCQVDIVDDKTIQITKIASPQWHDLHISFSKN